MALCCSGDDLYNDNPKEDIEMEDVEFIIPDQFKVIGEKHDEGLDTALTALKSHYKQADDYLIRKKCELVY